MVISIMILYKLLLTSMLTMLIAVIFLWPVNDKPVGVFRFFLFLIVEALMIDAIFIGYVSFGV